MLPETPNGLHVFADGCYEPNSGGGGWAFVAYRDAVEIASGFGGVQNSANNSTELIALLNAAIWINSNAKGEPAVIWSDSIYAIKGCNATYLEEQRLEENRPESECPQPNYSQLGTLEGNRSSIITQPLGDHCLVQRSFRH